MKIKFSIITPTFNRAASGLLEECIRSVQSQKKGDFEYEHIIIDDGSTDGTKELVENFAKEDSRVKYLFQENSGTPQAIRRGYEEAKGNWVVVLGDDDVLPNESLFLRANFIEKNPKVDWFYGKTQWVDDNDQPVKTWTQSEWFDDFRYERMLVSNFIQGGTTAVKAEILKKIKWPKWLKKSDDYYVALELLRPENNYDLGFLDEVLYHYRRHERGEGMQSQRSLADEKSRQERFGVDDKIRELHGKSLGYLASRACRAERELEKYKVMANDFEFLKEEVKRKEKYIDDLRNSKLWKISAGIKKIARRKK